MLQLLLGFLVLERGLSVLLFLEHESLLTFEALISCFSFSERIFHRWC